MVSERSETKIARRSKRRARLILLLGSVCFSLVIIEIGLRIAGYSYPEFYVADAQRGYALRAGMQGWYRKEGEAFVYVNRDGLRDREHAPTKPPNTIRIAVLGDSYPEAFQVSFENSFCAVLERKLEECPALSGRDVEVINFGVSGYGTAQELITLRNNVWQYSPDMVMLAFTTNNDVSDNVRALKKTDEIPYFVLREGKLVEDDSFLQNRTFRWRNSNLNHFGSWCRDHLRLIQLVNQAHHGIKAYLAARRERASQSSPGGATKTNGDRPGDAATAAAELGVDNVIYREPSEPLWQDAWRLQESLLETMRDEVRNHGARFVLVTLSNGIQVWPDAAAREAFLKRIGAQDIFYPDRRIRDFCKRDRIDVVTLAPEMQKYADHNKVFLHGFAKDVGNGHWNSAGHRLAAELTAKSLCELLTQNR